MASSSDRSQEHSCFSEWMVQQERDLSELVQAQQAAASPTNGSSCDGEAFLRQLVDKNIRHLQEYSERRIRLAREDVLSFFSPTWCSSLESSLLWLGGCRPTMLIRLIYALSGLQLESQLAQFLEGIRTVSFNQLSAKQLDSINDLHKRTIQEEERLSCWMASLQEQIGDQRMAEIVSECKPGKSESNRKADEALDEYEESMVSVIEAGDRLRLKTVKELMNVLSSVQAVNFLVASKKLHICVHEWGERRDRGHGRRVN